MNRQDQIHAFSLAAHRLAIERLRERPERLVEALDVIRRWQHQANGPAHCDPYWDEWQGLLNQGVDAVERAICQATDHAATLRSADGR